MRFINIMRYCHPKVLHQVSFHFVHPVTHPIKESDELAKLMAENATSCDKDLEEFLKLLLTILVKIC